MASRLLLQTKLEEILGSRNVYFQPPASICLSYPCIVYSLNRIPTNKADNINYILQHEYTATLIYKNPDENLKDKLLEQISRCSHDRHFVSDNLNHDVYTIIF